MIHGVNDKVTTAAGDISTRVDGDPSRVLLVLAHGAGAGMDHPFMEALAEALAATRLGVLRFNFAYTEQGRRAPDRQQVLETTYAEVVAEARVAYAPRALFLGGKSMGGRIASHLAASGCPCDGLAFFGYPLHPPGRPERIRDAHLYEIRVPMLFVQGTRDPFCPLERLEGVRAKLPGPHDLLTIDDGDHSFKVRRASGRTNEEALREVVEGAAAWVNARVAEIA